MFVRASGAVINRDSCGTLDSGLQVVFAGIKLSLMVGYEARCLADAFVL